MLRRSFNNDDIIRKRVLNMKLKKSGVGVVLGMENKHFV